MSIPIEEIEKVIGKIKISKITPEKPLPHWQLPCYYSLRTPLIILKNKKFKTPEGKKVGLLAFNKENLQGVAANLFH